MIDRSSLPNAFSTGEGSIIINLGIISRIRSDDQLAFVIGHELSHDFLEHTNKRFWKWHHYLNSKEFKERLKRIKKSDARQYSQLESLMKDLQISSSKHSRYKEEEADSLGFHFAREAGFSAEGSLAMLAMLDSVDQPKYAKDLDFNTLLFAEQLEFIRKRLDDRNGLILNVPIDSALMDSMKTHPDCANRIAQLRRTYPLEDKHFQEALWKKIGHQSDLEIIHYLLEKKFYGEALYRSLMIEANSNDNLFIKNAIGISLGQLYEAQKDHRLGKHVAAPNWNDGDNYRKIHNLIENIRLSELRQLTITHLRSYERTNEDEYSLLATYYLKKLSDQEYKIIENKLKEKFPNGIFINQLLSTN